MSGLTPVEYNQPDILALERWIDYRDGIVQLLDPATGTPLNGNKPPLWLASDERLAEGYQALNDPQYRHGLTIALSRHKQASDLGTFENRFTWFERTYARSDAAAFEEVKGWDPVESNDILQDLRSRSQWPPGLSSSRVFADRLLRSTLRHPQVAEFSYDIGKTDLPIDRLLLEMTHPEAPFSRLRQMEFPIQKTLKFAAGALREWYFPGKYMHELMKLDLPQSPRVLLTLGAAHRDVPRKFSVLGFSSHVRLFRLTRQQKDEVSVYAQAMREGRINFQSLGRLSFR